MIKDLSVTLFTELSESQKPLLSNGLPDLLQKTPSQVLTSVKTLHKTLTSYKKSMKSFKYYKKFTENEGYQKEMQKLDSEIRNHIKHELQMKVFIDKLEEKISDAKSSKDRQHSRTTHKDTIEKLLIENKALKSSLNLKVSEIEDLKRLTPYTAESKILTLREKVEAENEKISEVSKENFRIKQKCAQVKLELEFMNVEYERFKSEFLELKNLMRDLDGKKTQNKSIEKVEGAKEVESKTVRIAKTPTKNDNAVSPLKPTVREMAKKYSKTSQSTNKLEKSPLVATLKRELNKSKTKPKFQAYLNNKHK